MTLLFEKIVIYMFNDEIIPSYRLLPLIYVTLIYVMMLTFSWKEITLGHFEIVDLESYG